MAITIVIGRRWGRVEGEKGKKLGSKSESITMTAQRKSEVRYVAVIWEGWEVQAWTSGVVVVFSVQEKS